MSDDAVALRRACALAHAERVKPGMRRQIEKEGELAIAIYVDNWLATCAAPLAALGHFAYQAQQIVHAGFYATARATLLVAVAMEPDLHDFVQSIAPLASLLGGAVAVDCDVFAQNVQIIIDTFGN